MIKDSMSAYEANNPLNLLGQAPPPVPAVRLHGPNEPQLDLGWGQFHQGIASNFAELFRRARLPEGFLAGSFFKDAWIERRLPRRAIFAAALWHIAFLAMPFPEISGPKRNPAFANAQITWSGPIEDFPLIEMPAAKRKPSARGIKNQAPAQEGADAFHPRQRIFTDPVHPTHPRQTLINPAAPAELTSPTGPAQTSAAPAATPGPPAPVASPAGNLAARGTISPEGKKPGVPGGAVEAKPNSTGNSGADHGASATNSGGGAGTNSTSVSISGGAPRGTNMTSGLGAGKIAMPSSRPNYSRADANDVPDELARTTRSTFASLAPDAKPEAIFARRRVYSMNVNMPNLNSATGSWILNFSEMRTPPTGPQTNSAAEIAEPSPLRKVDPKYPPTLAAEHVEGEVILYAVIRRHGSVDSIQVVHGIDQQLDANAVRALAQWKFRPAERQGAPVDLEAIVHIPFHAPTRD